VSVIPLPYQGSDLLVSEDIRTVDKASDWLIGNMGTVMQGVGRVKKILTCTLQVVVSCC